jgi:hypothetical protein
MEELLDIPFDKDLKFFSFDIENTYSNIPIVELRKIIEVILGTTRFVHEN